MNIGEFGVTFGCNYDLLKSYIIDGEEWSRLRESNPRSNLKPNESKSETVKIPLPFFFSMNLTQFQLP